MRVDVGRTRAIAASLMLGLVLFLGPSPARADARGHQGRAKHVAIIVPPRSEQGVPSAVGGRAASVLSRALKGDHFSVIAPDQAVAIGESIWAEDERAGSQQDHVRECQTAECAVWYRAALNADVAVHLTLYAKPGSESSADLLDRVTLVMVRRPDVLSSASVNVIEGDLRSAVLSAYREAREQPGTSVAEALLAQSAPSESTRDEQAVDVAGTTDEATSSREPPQTERANSNLTLRLPAKSAGSARRKRFLQANAWDYAIGGSLLAVGAAHLVQYFIVTERANGTCAERGTNGCTAVYAPSSTDTRVLAGVGSAGIVLGALVIFEGPIGRLSARVDTRSAHLNFRGTF